MESISLYNGNATMHYYDSDHKYMWEEKQLPSSTTITGILAKPGLRYWYVNQAIDRIGKALEPGVPYDEVQLEQILKGAKYAGADSRDEAASIGRLVHSWIENYVTSQIRKVGASPEMPRHSGAKRSINQFMKWEEKSLPDYVFSERRMFSKQHLCAGTMDIACLLNGKPTIIDIKTGKAVYPEYWLQLASYAMYLDEEKPDNWDFPITEVQRLILLISQAKGTMQEVWADSDLQEDITTFQALRRVYRWKEGI